MLSVRKKKEIKGFMSNQELEEALSSFKWEHVEDENQVYEMLKINEIEDKSLMLGIFIRSLDKRVKIGNFKYSKIGINILTRAGDSIKHKKKYSKYILGTPFKKYVDDVKNRIVSKNVENQGVVLKVE